MTVGSRGPGGLLAARAVSYSYGTSAPGVVDASIEVAPGEVVGLVGPNGSGKSTLLKLLEGSLTPDRGEVEASPRRSPTGRVDIGYASESAAHFEVLSGRSNAVFFARAAGLGRSEAESSVAHLMETLGLAEDADRPVAEYSFGARRKLMLVEAIAHAPSMLLLDEPTVGLDAASKEALRLLLRDRAADGRTTLLAGHDLPLMAEAADRVAFMHRGRVVEGGRPSELLSRVGESVLFEIALAEPPDAQPRWPDHLRVTRDGNPLVIESGEGQDGLPDAVAALFASGARIHAVTVREPGLAEAFRQVVGEDLGPPRATGPRDDS